MDVIGNTLNKILYKGKYKVKKDMYSGNKETMYATRLRGRVKFPVGSKQFKYMMFKHLPFTVVKIKDGKKIYERFNVR